MEDSTKTQRRAVKFQAPKPGLQIDLSAANRELSPTASSQSNSRKQSAKAIATPSPKTIKELDKKYRDMNYFALVDALRTQLPTKQHNYRLKPYPSTLQGADIINWLVTSANAPNAAEAEYLATELMGHGHIYNVINEDLEQFEGGNQLYKFSAHDRIEFSVDLVDLDQVESFLSRSQKKKEMVIHDVTYRDVFRGSDVLDLIIQKGFVILRIDAIQICARMLSNSVFSVVQTKDNTNDFLDDVDSLYCLREQENRQGSRVGVPDFQDNSRGNSRQYSDHHTMDSEVKSIRNLFSSKSSKKQATLPSLSSPPAVTAEKNTTSSPTKVASRSGFQVNGRGTPAEVANMDEVNFDQIVDKGGKVSSPALKRGVEVDMPLDDELTPGNSRQASRKTSVKGVKSPLAESLKEELDEKFEEMDYFDLADSLQSELPTKTHARHSESYPNTLVGNDIVDWMISALHAETVEEAKYLGAKLVEFGHIANVSNEAQEEFEGGDELYKFCEEAECNIDWVDFDKAEAVLGQKSVQGAFAGSDAVDCLIGESIVALRSEAIPVCKKLLADNVIVMVNAEGKKPGFYDDKESFYNLRNPARPDGKAAGAPGLRAGVNQVDKMTTKQHNGSGIADTEVRSIRNLFGTLSPKKHTTATSAVSPLAKMKAEKSSMTSPTKKTEISNAARIPSPPSSPFADTGSTASRPYSTQSSGSTGREDTEVRSIRNLFGTLSPKKQTGTPTSPLQKMSKEKSVPR